MIQFKDEIIFKLKFSNQDLTNIEFEKMSVLTKIFEEKTVRQMSLTVHAGEIDSDRFEIRRTLLIDGELTF